MNIGVELEWEVSPAAYLWKHRAEFPAFPNGAALTAAIEVGLALEHCRLGEARRRWCVVVKAIEEAGRSARREGMSPRRVVAQVDRVREAVELVLFDGRLPPDLAAGAARRAGKMCVRAAEHALASYWQEA